jgi:hypothetical protein
MALQSRIRRHIARVRYVWGNGWGNARGGGGEIFRTRRCQPKASLRVAATSGHEEIPLAGGILSARELCSRSTVLSSGFDRTSAVDIVAYCQQRNREAEAAEPSRTPEQIERERERVDLKRAIQLEALGHRRDAEALRAHVRRRKAFARIMPGSMPAMILGPDRVGPSARGQLEGGRPQGRRATPKAAARSSGEPAEPEPGEDARRGSDGDDVAPGPQSSSHTSDELDRTVQEVAHAEPQVASVDVAMLRRVRAALPARETELRADLDHLIEIAEQRGWRL